MSSMSIVLLPEGLRLKLGDQAAKELVELVNTTNESVKNSTLETASDRFERRLSEFKGEVKAEISSVKADIIKWMFVFWIGQIAVISSIVYLK